MKLVEIHWQPTGRQLRQFGGSVAVAMPLVAWISDASRPTIGWLAVAGVVVATVGYAVPRILKPVFLAMSLLTAPIGIVVGEVSLLIIYFAVFTPLGLLFRLLGRDPLQMQIDRRTTTYWRKKPQPKNAASYYRQS